MFLSESNFSNIVRNTPLISIDLCILKGKKIFLGKRINPPAKNYFFVPGGRILKSESINIALKRILKNELGFSIKNDHYKFIKSMGIYEHFYQDNFLDNTNFSTHYLVLAYLINFDLLIKNKGNMVTQQHSSYIWLDINNLNNNSLEIHPYTLEYLNKLKRSI